MKCSKCGFENVDQSTYCINCGSRLDGKVRCPKCGEFMGPEEINCPHCGFTIPHNQKASSNGFNDKREKIKAVFTRVFAIASIILFSLAIPACWGFYLSFSSSNELNFWYGSAVYYLILNVIDGVNISSSGGLNPAYLASMWFDIGFKFLGVLLNIVVVTTASILGLTKSIGNLKNNTYKCHAYLAIVLLSNITCLFVLSSFSSSYQSNDSYSHFDISGTQSFLIAQIAIALVIMFISEPFFEFDKNKKSRFVNRVLISFIAFMGFAFIESLRNEFMRSSFEANNYNAVGLGSFISSYIANVGGTNSSSTISLLILSSLLFVLIILAITLVIVSVLFTVIHYFNNTYKKHHYYIPLYYMTITFLVIMTLCLIINISIHVILFNEKYGTIISNYSLYVVALIYAGFPFASTSVIRSIKQNSKLAEQTSVIESKEDGSH